MADNVTIDAGTNPTIAVATDEGSDGKHYQKVKLIDPTADSVTGHGISSNPINVLMRDGAGDSCMDDANNALKVNVVAGGGAGGGTSMSDDAAFTPGTTAVTPAGGTYRSVRDSVDDNDGGAFAMTQKRALLSCIETPTGDSAMDDTNDAVRVNIVAGSSAGTEYTEDAAAAANPAGGVLIVVRDDARGGSLTTADGDNVALRGTNSGEVYVKHVDSIAVTHAALTELAAAIDTEVQCDIVGALPAGTNAIGKLAANSGVDIGDVDVTSIVPGTGATNLGKAEDAAHSSGDVGVMALSVRQDTAAALGGTDADYQPLITDASGRLHVNVGNTVTVGSHAVTNAGTFAVQTAGDIAHDAADSGAPSKIGAKAEDALSGITVVADGDRTNLYADLDGVLVTKSHASHGDYVNGNASNTDGTSTQVIAASGAGIKTYITDVTLTNTSSSNIYVELKDGTTAKWTFPVPANGGVTHQFKTPLGGTANTAWNFDPSAATTTIYCSASGYKSKV